jgi:hypothetical protein
VEVSSPQNPVPWKRGRPTNNKEPGEAQYSNEPRAQLVVDKLLMHVVWIKPVEGSSQEICDRRRRTGTESMDVRESSQQLNREQLAIAELYQENRKLRRQLVERTVETSTS